MIEIKNLHKTYGLGGGHEVAALRGIDVAIGQGEIFGFIGLSGAGKTSLVRCISGLETATNGEIWVDGADLTKAKGASLRHARRKLGLVFQHFNLLMNATVLENVLFPMQVSKKPKAQALKKAEELLEMVGLSEKRNVYPAQLSGGQKQRVGIARALAGDPSIVICDEATSALDPATTKVILQLIKEINKKLNITFIMITHEMDVIKEICTKVAVLEDGRVIESGDVLDVLLAPMTDTGKRFFKTDDTTFKNPAYARALAAPGVVVKATFVGDSAATPAISRAIKRFDVDISILSGHIEEVNHTVIGRLIIKLDGTEAAIASSIAYLNENNILTEAVPHV